MGAAGTPTGPPVDDEFNRVSFLSHFEGANNGVNNAFDDGSASNHTVTANGNVTQGSFGPFARPDGEWGVDFDGSGDYLQAANSADWDLGTGNFTWECYANITDITRTQWFFSVFTTSSGQNAWGLRLESDGTLNAYFSGDGGESPSVVGVAAASSGLTENAWHHIAVVKNGTESNNIQVYVDGVSKATGTFGAIFDTNLPLTVGRQMNNSYPQYFLGQISNIRIIKGTALYTGNFTAPTSKLTAVTNTKLLTCQSNRFVDNSGNGHTVTPSGNAAVTAFGPFLSSSVYDPAVNGASLASLANGDYLNCTVNSDFSFGTADFSIEFYTYRTGADGAIFGAHLGGQSDGYYCYTSPPRLEVFSNGGSGGGINSNENTPNNSWFHVVISRQSGRLRIFIDGVLKNSTTTAYTINNDNRMFVIGGVTNGAGPYNGYITMFRVVNGSCAAAYQTSSTTNGAVIFTPPTAPLTAVTNTKLLLNMADGQAIDSAAQNNLTLYGNANTSTDQAKFGNTSLHLDGTGDFAETELSTAFGTGDFTIECFYYNSASFASANRYLFDFGSNGLRVQFYNGTIYYFVDANNSVTTTASGVTHNNWYHLAAVRYNGQMNLYIGGVSRATKNSVTTNLTERSLTIGDYGGGGQALQGFIDEFRISNFARYTSNFTAPSAAFPDKGQDA